MPYIIEIVRAGNTIEVSKYYSSRFNKRGIGRGKRKSLTTKEQREVNKRAAEKKLRRLINENFQEGDTHLVLDYKLSERPTGREGMRADADDFLKEMRKLYKSLGLVFKYIHVMEIGKKGALHHHLVINTPDEVSQRAITKAWKGRGRTHFNPLDDTGQYAKLAAYLIKQSDGRVKQFDSETRNLLVVLLNDGEPYEMPKGAIVRIECRKSDGEEILNDCTYVENLVTAEITEQMTAAAGYAECAISVYEKESYIASWTFNLKIDTAVIVGDKIASTIEYKAIINALQEVEKSKNTVEEATILAATAMRTANDTTYIFATPEAKTWTKYIRLVLTVHTRTATTQRIVEKSADSITEG